MVGHELREPAQRVTDRGRVRGRLAAHPLQKLVRADAADHHLRRVLPDRRETERDILEGLRVNTAEAEHDERPEPLVAAHAHNRLLAGSQHLLNQHAPDLDVRSHLLPDRGDHGLVGGTHAAGVAQVELHAAHVGLVQDLGAGDFHHHRIAHFVRGGHRLVGGSRQLAGHHVEAVLAEDLEGPELHDLTSAGGQLRGQQSVHLRLVHVVVNETAGRRPRPLREPRLGRHRPHRTFGKRVRRNLVLVQNLHAARHVGQAHHAGHDRLGRKLLGLADHPGDFRAVGHRLRRHQHHQLVHVLVRHYRVDRRPVAVLAGIADHIHRILQTSCRGHLKLERLDRVFLKPGELQVVADAGVGGHDARTARVGDDRRPSALRHDRVDEHVGIVEQIRHTLDAQHARLGHHRVIHLVGAGHRTGMRRGGRRPLRRPARLDGQDRLGISPVRDGIRRLDERSPVREILDVHHEHFRVRIGGDRLQQIDLGQIGLVAEAHKLREADVAPRRIVQQRRAQSAALADQPDRAPLGHLAPERRVHAHLRIRIDDSQAVGPDDRKAPLPGEGLQPVLALESVPADLLEARGDHDEVTRSFLRRRRHDALDRRGGHDHHAQIDRLIERLDPGRAADSQNALGFRVDRIKHAGVFAVHQIAHDVVADRPGRPRRTDHRDRAGAQQRRQISHRCGQWLLQYGHLGHQTQLLRVSPQPIPAAHADRSAPLLEYPRQGMIRSGPPPRPDRATGPAEPPRHPSSF